MKIHWLNTCASNIWAWNVQAPKLWRLSMHVLKTWGHHIWDLSISEHVRTPYMTTQHACADHMRTQHVRIQHTYTKPRRNHHSMTQHRFPWHVMSEHAFIFTFISSFSPNGGCPGRLYEFKIWALKSHQAEADCSNSDGSLTNRVHDLQTRALGSTWALKSHEALQISAAWMRSNSWATTHSIIVRQPTTHSLQLIHNTIT